MLFWNSGTGIQGQYKLCSCSKHKYVRTLKDLNVLIYGLEKPSACFLRSKKLSLNVRLYCLFQVFQSSKLQKKKKMI